MSSCHVLKAKQNNEKKESFTSKACSTLRPLLPTMSESCRLKQSCSSSSSSCTSVLQYYEYNAILCFILSQNCSERSRINWLTTLEIKNDQSIQKLILKKSIFD